MNSKKYVFTILLLIIICALAFAGNAADTYLPFNPVDGTSVNDVTDYFFWDMGNRIKLNYTFLTLEKNKNELRVAEEVYNRTGYQEIYEYELPAARIIVYSYLREFLGIQIDPSEKVSINQEHYSDCEMNNQGKITLTKKDNNNTYHVLRFETNGANVPFIDNPDVKVIGLIFLKEGIPILGIKNSKYYPMINHNGQWIRTNAIDQVQIKNESISDSGQLLKQRPWTKLARYIIPADSTEQYEQTTLSYADLYEGLLVLVKRDDFYYPGSISTLYNEKIYILFCNADFNDIFDDDSAIYPLEKLKPLFWQQGTNIQARMQHSRQWVRCTIWDIDTEDERANVFIEDADVPMWVSFADCRQEAGSSVGDVFDDSVIAGDDVEVDNDYDDNYTDMDEGWEEFFEYLEEQGIDPADLSDEEFMEILNQIYED